MSIVVGNMVTTFVKAQAAIDAPNSTFYGETVFQRAHQILDPLPNDGTRVTIDTYTQETIKHCIDFTILGVITLVTNFIQVILRALSNSLIDVLLGNGVRAANLHDQAAILPLRAASGGRLVRRAPDGNVDHEVERVWLLHQFIHPTVTWSA